MSTPNQNDIMNWVNQMGIKNPKMQMLAQLMNQNQEVQEKDSEEVNRTKKLIQQIKKQHALIKKLDKSNKMMKEKINFLADNLDYRIEMTGIFAAAVGACPDCFGQDPSCKECHGTGKPGTFPIDRESYASIIIPAIEACDKKHPTHSNGRQ